MKRIVGLVQARMGSTRLPGKVMLPLAGQPLVGHIFGRLAATQGVTGLVLSTTVDPRNEPLVTYARSRGVAVDQGPHEDDIAERLHRAVELTDADAVLKVNGDCPLVDPGVLGLLTGAWLAEPSLDYVSNKIVWTWPEGLSAEVIGRPAINWCHENLTTTEDREFVANWIRDHPERFRRLSVEGKRDLSRHGWSVDTPEDFAFVSDLFAALQGTGEIFGLDAILAHLTEQATTHG